MKNIIYSTLLLSALGYAGGMIGESNVGHIIDQSDMAAANQVVVTPPKVVVTPTKVEEATNFYVGLSLAATEVNGESTTVILKGANPLAAIGKVGYNITENIAIEGRAGLGVKKDTIGSETSEIDNLAAVYIKPNVNVTHNINLFGLLGYGKVKQTLINESIVTSGASYGVGAAYNLNSTWAVVADAVRYAKEDNNRVDAYSIGVEYAF
jgi:hypothetical protein